MRTLVLCKYCVILNCQFISCLVEINFEMTQHFPFLLLSTKDNYQFLKGMKSLVTKSGYKLKICYEYMNRGDRWMQVNSTAVQSPPAETGLGCFSQEVVYLRGGNSLDHFHRSNKVGNHS